MFLKKAEMCKDPAEYHAKKMLLLAIQYSESNQGLIIV